jgi:hypothetical protein
MHVSTPAIAGIRHFVAACFDVAYIQNIMKLSCCHVMPFLRVVFGILQRMLYQMMHVLTKALMQAG